MFSRLFEQWFMRDSCVNDVQRMIWKSASNKWKRKFQKCVKQGLRLFQGSCKIVKSVSKGFPRSFKGVSRNIWWRFKKISNMFLVCFREVSYFSSVFRMFQAGFKSVSRNFCFLLCNFNLCPP